MNNVEILIVAVVVIAVVVGLVLLLTQRRRSAELRERFGPEYERTMETARDRREAEADLRARKERVDALEIRPLEPTVRDRFAERWREVQAMFVDDPANAVDQADTLIGEVMRARGYPVGDFEQRAADISVNHPHVVDHYRTAHSIAVKRRAGEGATEQLRQAFVHYRALFADLLEVPGTGGGERAETAPEQQAAAPERPTAAPEQPSAATTRADLPPSETPPSEPPPAAEPAEGPSSQRSRLASGPTRPMESGATEPEPGTTVASQEPVDSARSSR